MAGGETIHGQKIDDPWATAQLAATGVSKTAGAAAIVHNGLVWQTQVQSTGSRTFALRPTRIDPVLHNSFDRVSRPLAPRAERWSPQFMPESPLAAPPAVRAPIPSPASVAARAATGCAPARVTVKFRGEPFAFGTGTRSQRALAMAEEAAKASNVRLFDVVDEVRYVRGSSYFDVDLAGRRILHIGENAFGRNRTGQILEATHELIHAQRYNNVLRGRGGNFVQAYDDYFLAKPFGSDLYALEEVTTELLALRRVENYLGGLSPQQRAASTRYINDWLSGFRGN